MKKYFKGLLVISLIIVLGACSKQEKTIRREVSKDINTELVKKVTGTWLGEGEKENKLYNITNGETILGINGEELEITSTDNNWVKSQTKSEQLFFYDFEIKEDSVTVYPSFPTEKGKQSNPLAPIQLKKIDSKEIEVNYFNPDEVKNYEDSLKLCLSEYEANEAFSLKMKRFTKEGNPIIEIISFDGTFLYYYYDNSADQFGEKEIINAKYKQFKYEEKKDDSDTVMKQFVLVDPVSKESEKEVVFDIQNLE